MELSAHMLKVQKLEERACQKAGMRFHLLDERALLSKGGEKYAAEFTETLIKDVTPEILEAANLGIALGKEINAKVSKRAE